MPTESLDSRGTLQERLAQIRSRSAGRLGMAPLVRAGSALGGALAGNRPLGREDRTVLGTLSIGILIVAVLAGLFPTVVGWTVASAAFWFGAAMGIRAFAQARRGRAEEREGVFYSKTLNEERETAP